MKKDRKTDARAFVYYFDWAEALLEMPADMRLKIDDAIKRYALYGEEPTDPTVKYSSFALIRQQIDRNKQEYSERCEKTRQARSEAGRKGGAPVGNSNASKNKLNKLNKPYSDSYSDSDSDMRIDKEKSTNVDTKKTAQRFSPPSVDVVRDYIASKSYSVDAEAFVDFYEAKGWRVGSNPMRDWEAAIRTWERRNKTEGKASPQKTTAAPDGVTLGAGEYIDNTGRRTYGTGKATIPPAAPPRPSEKHVWDSSTSNWLIL